MAGSDFIPTHLSFRVSDCLSAIKQIYSAQLDDLSQHLVNLVRGEIWLNGNGSSPMRLTAVAAVKETKREITDDEICLEAGVDPDLLQSAGEAILVRVSVVLHGNQANGPLTTKPGELTWTKHVLVKRLSPATEVTELPDGFNQNDAMPDILKDIENNISNELNRYVNVFIRNVEDALNSIDWSAFVTEG